MECTLKKVWLKSQFFTKNYKKKSIFHQKKNILYACRDHVTITNPERWGEIAAMLEGYESSDEEHPSTKADEQADEQASVPASASEQASEQASERHKA